MTQTIALVDDDRNILTSISIALEKEGYKVQTYLDLKFKKHANFQLLTIVQILFILPIILNIFLKKVLKKLY